MGVCVLVGGQWYMLYTYTFILALSAKNTWKQ